MGKRKGLKETKAIKVVGFSFSGKGAGKKFPKGSRSGD